MRRRYESDEKGGGGGGSSQESTKRSNRGKRSTHHREKNTLLAPQQQQADSSTPTMVTIHQPMEFYLPVMYTSEVGCVPRQKSEPNLNLPKDVILTLMPFLQQLPGKEWCPSTPDMLDSGASSVISSSELSPSLGRSPGQVLQNPPQQQQQQQNRPHDYGMCEEIESLVQQATESLQMPDEDRHQEQPPPNMDNSFM